MNNNFKIYVLEGKYYEALNMIKDLNDEDLEERLYDELIELGFDTENMNVYYFIKYMISNSNFKKDMLHIIASEILSTAFSHIDNIYFLALDHARKAIEINPINLEYKKAILFFYGMSDEVLPKDEAIRIASEILKYEPNDEIARKI